MNILEKIGCDILKKRKRELSNKTRTNEGLNIAEYVEREAIEQILATQCSIKKKPKKKKSDYEKIQELRKRILKGKKNYIFKISFELLSGGFYLIKINFNGMFPPTLNFLFFTFY
jgi:hypothetical protein